MDIQNSRERDHFWQAYKACTAENGVCPDRSLFYVKWAKTSAFFVADKPIYDRSRKDIALFLDDLRNRQSIEGCQVRQADRTLKIFSEIFLPHDSPEKKSSLPAETRDEDPAQEAVVKTNGFHYRVIPGEMERRFATMVEGAKSAIRTRHYSHRKTFSGTSQECCGDLIVLCGHKDPFDCGLPSIRMIRLGMTSCLLEGCSCYRA